MALHLARPKRRSLTNPSLLHLFSTSSNDPNNERTTTNDEDSSNNPSPFSSYFRDVKGSLRQQQKERPTSPFSQNPSNPSIPTSKSMSLSASLEEIRKNLSEFRRRSAVPPPSESSPMPSQPQPQISFQELYRRNVLAKQGESKENPSSSGPGGKLRFDTIRESLRQMRPNFGATNVEKKTGPFLSLNNYKESFKLKPSDANLVSPLIGGSSMELPSSVFGREMKEMTKEEEAAMKTEFVRMYSHGELGEKLKQLRPERKEGEGWFSLQELNERLMKLREMEQKETESRIGGVWAQGLRESLRTMAMTEDQKQKKTFGKFSGS